VRDWVSGADGLRSMAVASDGSYGIGEGIISSFPVRLHGGGENSTKRITNYAEIQRLVEPAVGFQPGDAIARYRRSPIWRELDKITADQDFAVRLHRNCKDKTVTKGNVRVDPWVERIS